MRQHGLVPIDVFAPHLEQPLDFSRVHPTGVLAYWPVSKPNSDNAKLGSNCMGVYLGPAAMHSQTGHLVLTHKGHVLHVPHVHVYSAVKPFQGGLVDVLSLKLFPVLDLTIDLAAHVRACGQPDWSGNSAVLSGPWSIFGSRGQYS